MPPRKFTVYLAGPIHGCNEAQKHNWREKVKSEYANDFDFIDPSADAMLEKGATQEELVKADIENIGRSDGILANMWRESIGTTLGIVHAFRKGRPVVVADPNELHHRMLAFYIDATEDNPLKAAKTLRKTLSAEDSWQVRKSGNRKERFDRRKIRLSVQQFCREHDVDDIGVPVVVFSRVMDELDDNSTRRIRDKISTTDISKAVRNVFKKMERDDLDFPRLSDKWRRLSRPPTGPSPVVKERPSLGPFGVPVYSQQSHSTIWGKSIQNLEAIPSSDARHILATIQSVAHVNRIVLGRFSGQQSRPSCCATVLWSDAPFVLEGKLFDKGETGTLQTFQVRVREDGKKGQALQQIAAFLQREGLWAG